MAKTLNSIAELYDDLSRGTLVQNILKYGNRFASLNAHKRLKIPADQRTNYRKNGDAAYLNDLLLDLVELPEHPYILDAGCGFGGMIFHLFERTGGRYDGYTFSRVQQQVAQKAATKKGLSEVCRFYLRDYNDPIEEKYDAILAVESLIHSSDLKVSIQNLSRSLKPGGQLIIVDDVFENSEAKSSIHFQILMKYWLLDNIWSESDFLDAINGSGLIVLNKLDLTKQVNLLKPEKIEKNIRLFNRLIKFIPVPLIKSYLRIQLGGFALQRLYLEKMVKYKVYIAVKS